MNIDKNKYILGSWLLTIFLSTSFLFGYGSADHLVIAKLVADMPQLKAPIAKILKANAEYLRAGALFPDGGSLKVGELAACFDSTGALDADKVVVVLKKKNFRLAEELATWQIADQWPWMSSHNPAAPDWYVDAIHKALIEGNDKKTAFLCGAVTHLSECLVGYHSRAMGAHGATGKKYKKQIQMGGDAMAFNFPQAYASVSRKFSENELKQNLADWYRCYLFQRYERYANVLQWKIADENLPTPEHAKKGEELAQEETIAVFKFCVKLFNEAATDPFKPHYNGAEVLIIVHAGLANGANLSYFTLMSKNNITYEFCSQTLMPDLSKYKAVIVLAGFYQPGMRACWESLANYIKSGGKVILVGTPVFGPEGTDEFKSLANAANLKWCRDNVDYRYDNHRFVMDALRQFWGEARINQDAADSPKWLCDLAEQYAAKIAYHHCAKTMELSDTARAKMRILFDFSARLADCRGGWINLDGTITEKVLPFDMEELVDRPIDSRPIIKLVTIEQKPEDALPEQSSSRQRILFESSRQIVFLTRELSLPLMKPIILSFSYNLRGRTKPARHLQVTVEDKAKKITCLLDQRIEAAGKTKVVKSYNFDISAWAGQKIKIDFRLRNVGRYTYVADSFLESPALWIPRGR